MANRPDKKNKVMQRRWKESEEESDGPPVGPRGGTLVVCPTIAIKQWQSELARFVKPGTLKVVIHHGAKRTTSAQVGKGSGGMGGNEKTSSCLTTHIIVFRAAAAASFSCGGLRIIEKPAMKKLMLDERWFV